MAVSQWIVYNFMSFIWKDTSTLLDLFQLLEIDEVVVSNNYNSKHHVYK